MQFSIISAAWQRRPTPACHLINGEIFFRFYRYPVELIEIGVSLFCKSYSLYIRYVYISFTYVPQAIINELIIHHVLAHKPRGEEGYTYLIKTLTRVCTLDIGLQYPRKSTKVLSYMVLLLKQGGCIKPVIYQPCYAISSAYYLTK